MYCGALSGDSDERKDNLIVRVSRRKLVTHSSHSRAGGNKEAEVMKGVGLIHDQTTPSHQQERPVKTKRKFKHSSQAGTTTYTSIPILCYNKII